MSEANVIRQGDDHFPAGDKAPQAAPNQSPRVVSAPCAPIVDGEAQARYIPMAARAHRAPIPVPH